MNKDLGRQATGADSGRDAASMRGSAPPLRLADLEVQNVGGDQQGITTIVVDGDMLEVEGWYDAVAIWFARVRLTPEQRAALREAL